MYGYEFSGEVSTPSFVASAHARSFFVPFFLQRMIQALPFSSFPVCSLLAEESISPLRLSPLKSMPLSYERILSFFVPCDSNFKPQNNASSVCSPPFNNNNKNKKKRKKAVTLCSRVAFLGGTTKNSNNARRKYLGEWWLGKLKRTRNKE